MALLDRLAQVVLTNSPSSSAVGGHSNVSLPDVDHPPTHGRRPLLVTFSSSSPRSIAQLVPFLTRVSGRTFDHAYGGGAERREGEGEVDWEAVERGFRAEVFEG